MRSGESWHNSIAQMFHMNPPTSTRCLSRASIDCCHATVLRPSNDGPTQPAAGQARGLSAGLSPAHVRPYCRTSIPLTRCVCSSAIANIQIRTCISVGIFVVEVALHWQLNTSESVPAPLTAMLPLARTPSATAFTGVVVSRVLQRLMVVTHTLLNVPAPATLVTTPLHGVIVTTPAVVESRVLPHSSSTGLTPRARPALLPRCRTQSSRKTQILEHRDTFLFPADQSGRMAPIGVTLTFEFPPETTLLSGLLSISEGHRYIPERCWETVLQTRTP